MPFVYYDLYLSTMNASTRCGNYWIAPSARAALTPPPLTGLKLARAHLAALTPAVASVSLAPRPPLAARHAAPRRAGTAREHRLRAGSRRRAR